MAKSKVINLLSYLGELKVKLPIENWYYGDYTLQVEENYKVFCVNKCKVKDNSNWGCTRISAKLTAVPKEEDVGIVASNYVKTTA